MKRAFVLPAALLALAITPAQAVSAEGHDQVLQANLSSLNGSGASSTATVTVSGDEMTVEIHGSGFTPGSAPHAQHLHGVVGEANHCPTAAEDEDGNGIVTTSEGAHTYGPILVSLTTEGDMSPDSGLAVDRFPVSDAAGNLSYSRTFPVPAGLGDVDFLHVVQHGVDFDGSGAYDGSRMSDLDPSLPAEATDPATCGELAVVPAGGVATGGGGTAQADASGGIAPVWFGVGGVALAAAAGGTLRRRRSA